MTQLNVDWRVVRCPMAHSEVEGTNGQTVSSSLEFSDGMAVLVGGVRLPGQLRPASAASKVQTESLRLEFSDGAIVRASKCAA